ncbi:TetR/AcrR family transcriptional regulator [Sphingosinicella sp. BN140058]|uniref:TetR/AcrR family transcriptional regulator n=1 Tax=Sphingosinicella sp. BN140058 TaxID=1892855 RepID=UPI0010129E0B|nr:TetR/AcrR family transcriptional regulator [Sphingosinicella sp. BN140058]QAY77805.1 TetR/AcrR family transcriptional regulator [Sphingosinicella sp. BN140058]
MVQNESTRRRGRPPAFDRDDVLLKARDAFWRSGYAATSLDDLAAATGLNRPSLYGAFGDKRALYLATLERTRADMLAALERALAAPGPLRLLLTRLYAGAVQLYRRGDPAGRGCFLVGTAVTEAAVENEVRTVLTVSFEQLDGAFEAKFREALAELPPGADPVAHAKLATGMLHTLAVRARGGASEAELQAVADAAVTMLCGAGTKDGV